MNIKTMLINFIKDEEGLTMVEYAIAGALVAGGAAAAFTLLGTTISDSMGTLTSFIPGATQATP